MLDRASHRKSEGSRGVPGIEFPAAGGFWQPGPAQTDNFFVAGLSFRSGYTELAPSLVHRNAPDPVRGHQGPIFTKRGERLLQAFAGNTAKRLSILVLAGGLAGLAASPSNAQILHKKKKVNKSTSADNTAEPDKVLYSRAIEDIKHGRQEVGRLSLQTLINTYPDSEYLAKAKLAIADSYYKEGGTANLTQAIQAYKDFDIFFPFLPEAGYAQLQVANAHYKQIAKPDRDRTEAKAAEEEFQTFLEKYPKDPLAPQAEQRLRNVQEIIAEGDYRIGYFYYVKGDKRAAAARLIAITKRYPLYSKSDHALWMLGDIFERSEHKEIASLYYSQIVRNYPLSALVPDAKGKLKAFKVPVPQPDPKAQAWMVAEQNTPRQHDSLIKKPLALVRSGPHAEIISAARTGAPNLQPEADNTSATDILTPGNRSQLGGSAPTAGNAAVVEIVTPGSGASAGTGNPSGTDEAPAAAPSDGSAPTSAGAAADPKAAANPAPPPAAPDATTNPVTTTTTSDNGAPAQNADGTKAAGSQDSASAATDSGNQKESTSKKKKGLRKIVPW
jgi:outer membrane protein assembly factor BamD